MIEPQLGIPTVVPRNGGLVGNGLVQESEFTRCDHFAGSSRLPVKEPARARDAAQTHWCVHLGWRTRARQRSPQRQVTKLGPAQVAQRPPVGGGRRCSHVSEAVSDWAILAVHLGPPLSLLHEDLRTVLPVKGSLRRATPARP